MNESVVYRPLRSVLMWEEFYHLYEWEFTLIQLLLWEELLGWKSWCSLMQITIYINVFQRACLIMIWRCHKICVVDILLDLQYFIVLFEIIAFWAVKLIYQYQDYS